MLKCICFKQKHYIISAMRNSGFSRQLTTNFGNHNIYTLEMLKWIFFVHWNNIWLVRIFKLLQTIFGKNNITTLEMLNRPCLSQKQYIISAVGIFKLLQAVHNNFLQSKYTESGNVKVHMFYTEISYIQ